MSAAKLMTHKAAYAARRSDALIDPPRHENVSGDDLPELRLAIFRVRLKYSAHTGREHFGLNGEARATSMSKATCEE